jgi:hypothetical protein
MHRGAAVAILLATAFLVSGCQYLLGLNGLNGTPPGPVIGSFDPGALGSFDPGVFGSFDPGNPDESLPPPIATYTTGTASVTIGGTVTTLDGLTEPGTLYQDFGAEGSWTDGKGMYVQFNSDPSGASGAAGFVQIDRISGGQHLAAADPSRCKVTVKKADTTGLSGSATCTGLTWIDTMGGFNGLTSSPPPIGAPFDATVTFEAAP